MPPTQGPFSCRHRRSRDTLCSRAPQKMPLLVGPVSSSVGQQQPNRRRRAVLPQPAVFQTVLRIREPPLDGLERAEPPPWQPQLGLVRRLSTSSFLCTPPETLSPRWYPRRAAFHQRSSPPSEGETARSAEAKR